MGIGGRISSDWREVCCSAPVGLSMRGTFYMGAGGPVDAEACGLILVLNSLVDTPMGGPSYEGTGGPVQLVDLPMGRLSCKGTGGRVKLVEL